VKFVVDTNVLFSFFKKETKTRNLILSDILELYAPEIARKELQKHSLILTRKANISLSDFKDLTFLLEEHLKFVPLADYKAEFPQVLTYTKEFSYSDIKEFLDDLDFFALATKQQCPLWSNDALFKKQKAINVLTTAEMVSYIRAHKRS
jgi:predicted nucleic acid-binding protein